MLRAGNSYPELDVASLQVHDVLDPGPNPEPDDVRLMRGIGACRHTSPQLTAWHKDSQPAACGAVHQSSRIKAGSRQASLRGELPPAKSIRKACRLTFWRAEHQSPSDQVPGLRVFPPQPGRLHHSALTPGLAILVHSAVHRLAGALPLPEQRLLGPCHQALQLLHCVLCLTISCCRTHA